jgi:flagellar motor switch protein FliG
MNLKDRQLNAYNKTLGKNTQADEAVENKSGFKKTVKPEQPPVHKPAVKKPDADNAVPRLTGGYQKTAKFLLLIGKEEASKIMQHLNKEEIEGIAKEIIKIKKVDIDEAAGILSEFGRMKFIPPSLNGGREAAEEILNKAFGADKTVSIIQKVLPYGGEKPFSFLEDLELPQLLLILKNESNAVMSVIIPFLPPKLASSLIKKLLPVQQTEIIRRIAGAEKISPQVIAKIEEVLKERIRKLGKTVTVELDGKNVLAEILKNMTPDEGESILRDLEDVNPEISHEIKEKIFTIDIIFDIRKKDFQKLLSDFTEKELAVIIKGKTAEISDYIISNISERRRELIRLEADALGMIRRSDIDRATRDFLNYIRQQEAQNLIVISKDKEEYI